MVSLNHCYCKITNMAFNKAVAAVQGHVNMQRQVLRLCNGRHCACAVNLGMSNGSFYLTVNVQPTCALAGPPGSGMGMGMMDPGMMGMMGPGPDLYMGFDMPPGECCIFKS